MKKANIIFVLLMLLLSMIPISAEPIGDEKIKVIYVSSRPESIERMDKVTLNTTISDKAILENYLGHNDYYPEMEQLKSVDFTDYNIIILDTLSQDVFNQIKTNLETTAENSEILIIVRAGLGGYLDNTGMTSAEQERVGNYLKYPSENNFCNFIRTLLLLKGVETGKIPEPTATEIYGVYHPDVPDGKIFKNASEYLEWYKNRPEGHVYDENKPTIGVITSAAMNDPTRDSPVWDYFVRSIEEKGYNVLVGTYVHAAEAEIGPNANRDNFIIDGKTVVDSIISISRGARLFSYASDLGAAELENMGVPVLNGVQLYAAWTHDDWRNSDQGVPTSDLYQLAFAEQDGMIESIVIATKDGTKQNLPIKEQADWMVERAISWAEISYKTNDSKKIVIPYYAAEAGKSNIGSDPDYYLDAPKSLMNLLKALEDADYDVGDLPDSPEELIDLMVKNGHNVGTWAPGKVEELVRNGYVKLLPAEDYINYYNTVLSNEQRAEMSELWGEPPGNIMTYRKDGADYFVIPTIEFGNVVLTPQPLRGRDQSIKALKHEKDYPPTHQMLATYYYFNEVYDTDVYLPLWSNLAVMPGNKATLAADDWTALMIQDKLHIHVLPMDATGITDKRRANMVIISFLTPYLMPGGLNEELTDLENKISEYEIPREEEIQQVALELVKQSAEENGLDTALNLDWESPDEAVAKLKSHLNNIKRSFIPIGDHVLGEPPTSDEIFKQTAAMLTYNTFEPVKENVKVLINLDNELEILGKSDKKEELLKAVLEENPSSWKSPNEAVSEILGGSNSNIEYALWMAWVYKLNILASEKPSQNQGKEYVEMLLSYDVNRKINSTHSYNINFNTKYNDKTILSEPEKSEKREELIDKIIFQDENADELITEIFGENAFKKMTGENNSTASDVYYVLKNVKAQIDKLNNPTNEIQSILNALEGKYIPTGQTGDPIKNFEAVPTGRNPIQDDSREIPTDAAILVGKQLAKNLIAKYQKENPGEYPNKVAFLLWAVEAARTGGASEAELLYLMGVEPVRGTNGRISGVQLISGWDKPRVDVVVETSGSYRDSYGSLIDLINQAVKLAANAPDNGQPNHVYQNSEIIKEALIEGGMDPTTAEAYQYARVFGPAPGEYTPGIENIAGSGLENEEGMSSAELYLKRMSYVYGIKVNGQEVFGKQMPSLLESNLKDVEMGVFSRSSNLYGLLDHPMVASYFGGLASAIEKSGGTADMYINNLRNGETDVQSLSEFLSMDLSSRYLNPEWIKGMMDSGYAGTSHMNEFFDVMGIWEMTMPNLVTDKMWNNMYETYISDSKDTGVNEFLKKENAYAYQAMVANLLNSIYNGDWSPSEEVQKQLEKEYVEQTNINGVVCCHHTCSNMKFNENIVNGLLSMDISKAEKQKYLNELNIALDKDFALPRSGGSSGGTGSAFVTNSTEEEGLSLKPIDTDMPGAGFGQDATPAGAQEATTQGEQSPQITGYEMITKTMSQTTSSIKDFISNPSVSSSSIMAIAFVVLVVVAIFYGFKRKGI